MTNSYGCFESSESLGVAYELTISNSALFGSLGRDLLKLDSLTTEEQSFHTGNTNLFSAYTQLLTLTL